MKKYRPKLHLTYWIHKIFANRKGIYMNGSYKVERERKKLIRIGWACIKEGLINVLSLGMYTADYALDEAFREEE